VQNRQHPVNLAIRRAQPDELDAVLALYRDCGYGGGVDPADITLLAKAGAGIVGAARVCLEQGTLVLRGVQVRAEYHRQGIGKRLLAAAIPHLDRAVCYCLPYSHLVDFYASKGFRVVDAGSLPEFLRDRLDGYIAQGQDLLGMRRDPPGDAGQGSTI